MPEAAMLELDQVKLVYNRGRVDEVVALRGLDLRLGAGEFVTVVGSNGAGKSSTVQVVSDRRGRPVAGFAWPAKT